ncbi:MAG TPA: GyrI-like domain-containing protein, partial [Mucilaginibacter sp.]
ALTITVNKTRLKSRIAYLPGDLSVDVVWTTDINSGINPVQRVKAYCDAQKLKAGVSDILNQLKTFLQNDRNAYGYHIYIDKVKDPILLATSVNQSNYPGMPSVYAIISKLKSQAVLKGAKQTAFPMLNITKVSPASYQVSMALPVDKMISTDKGTFINKMVAGGNLLVTDVKGGPNTIADALGQIKQYMKDHKLISPAMPFESLVTDRVAERDTSKWVTKIYYPIF